MAADLGLVTHPAERQADELAVGGAGDRLGERRLADARRAREGEDGALRLLDQRTHRQELEDAVLDLLQAEVVLVEDLLGADEIPAFLGLLVPGNGDQPVEVVARDRRLGRHRRHRLEPAQLLNGLLGRFLRHPCLVDFLAQFLDLVALVVLATQFLLDRLHLLVEVVLFLRLLHLLLDARLDAAVDLELVHFAFEHAGDAVETLDGRDDLEEVLLLLDADEQVSGDGVAQLRRVVDADGGDHGVEVQVVRELDVLLEHRDDAAHHRLDVGGHVLRARDHLHDDPEEALVFLPLDRAGAVDTLDQHLDVAVGQLQALHDVGDAAHREDVVRLRLVHRGVVLGGEEDPLVLAEGVFEGPDRRRTPDHERHHHVREHDDIPQRNDGEGLVHFHRGALLQEGRETPSASLTPPFPSA